LVGPREALAVAFVELAAPSWTTGTPPVPSQDVTIQLRAHGRPLAGRVVANGTGHETAAATTPGVTVLLHEPAHGVALGQSAVVHDGDHCLGGGRITAVSRPDVPARVPAIASGRP
ncbi:MAG TPA: aminomethyltransferase beta-barrel domain-containing protein, partial [Nitriliruptoraceae bacterium]|nr:aminomethyltransferase beta-barrel domain-containing protein [Nitriliruptoraceae bacterium]